MHRYFALLIPLVVLSYRTPEQIPTPVHPVVPLSALLERLDTVQSGHDRDKIAQACDAILLAQPENYRAQMTLAGLHFARQDYRRAAGDYARVLLTHPKDPEALSAAAWAAIRIGDLSRAANDLVTLLEISPDYPEARLAYDIATGRRGEGAGPLSSPLATSASKRH